MTMSAATAMFVVVLVLVIAATILTTFAMMMSTTVTAACQHLDGLVDLFLCGVAVFADGAREVEHLACQRVIGVDGNAIFLHLHDSGHELVVLTICQGDDGIGVDVLMVEMTVD